MLNKKLSGLQKLVEAWAGRKDSGRILQQPKPKRGANKALTDAISTKQ